MSSSALKQVALTVAQKSGVFAIRRAATASTLRVLAYHGVEKRTGIDNLDGFQVDPSVFERQIDHVARCYRLVSLQDVVAAYAEGAPLPPRAVLITFDDGYLNNAEIAAPVLLRKGAPAAFFLTTGFIDGTHTPWWYLIREWIAVGGAASLGRPAADMPHVNDPRASIAAWERYLKIMSEQNRQTWIVQMAEKLGRPARARISFMTWHHVRDLFKQGFALGAHTVRHVNLGVEDEAVVRSEIVGSAGRIQSEVGSAGAAFAFPYGRATDLGTAADAAMHAAHIRIGLTTIHGINRRTTPPLRLRRLNVTTHYDGPAFEKLLALGG